MIKQLKLSDDYIAFIEVQIRVNFNAVKNMNYNFINKRYVYDAMFKKRLG